MEPSPPKIGVLAIRLAVWFILLATLPILVFVVFIRQNAQAAFVNLENSHQYEMVAMLAGQVALLDNLEDAQSLLSALEQSQLNAFILRRDGTYLAHVDDSKINGRAANDFSPDAIQAILSEEDGLYSGPTSSYFFAFTSVPDREAVVVLAAEDATISAVIRQLERDSYLQLIISLLIVLVGSGVVIWLLIGLPVKKLTRAAEQLSAGQLDVQVDPSDMVDDLAVLGTTFNSMVNRIRELIENLEQRVATRTQELSTFFDLTVLASHAATLDEVFQQAVPRIQEITRSRVICLHLFDADRAGLYLAAQQNLPDQDHTRLQNVAVTPDFQRWLQHPNDPLVTTSLAQLAILPPSFRLAEFQTYLGAQIRMGNQIEGVLSCYRFTGRGFGLDEISLAAALAEQMGMVLETQRLRQIAEEVAVLEERQRLARELHDSVTQSIYSLTLFARSGREASEDGDMSRLVPTFVEIEDTALYILQEMRLLLYELRAPLLERDGLVQAIDSRLNLVERRAGLQVTYEEALAQRKLPKTVETELYRLAIEALNNVIKHASAHAVTVRLGATNGRVCLDICDDGRGFDPRQPAGGFGLTGMRERVDRLGGVLKIASVPGQGTKISIEVEVADE